MNVRGTRSSKPFFIRHYLSFNRIKQFWLGIFGLLLGVFALPLMIHGMENADKTPSLQGTIVWETNRDGNWEIYRMNQDGSNQVRLTHNPLPDSAPKWAPDGRRIYFQRVGKDGVPSILSIGEHGLDERVVVQNGSVYSLSEKGKTLVFERLVNGRYLFYKKNLESGVEEEIPIQDIEELRGKEARGPVLSPDGRWLGLTFKTRGWNIRTVDLNTRKIYRVGKGCEPAWSPDGNRLLWSRARGIGRTSIWSADRWGGNHRVVSDMRSSRSHEYFPQWSNDGRFVVFAVCPNSQHDPDRSDYDIFITKLDSGSPPIRLTVDPSTDRYPSLFIPNS